MTNTGNKKKLLSTLEYQEIEQTLLGEVVRIGDFSAQFDEIKALIKEMATTVAELSEKAESFHDRIATLEDQICDLL